MFGPLPTRGGGLKFARQHETQNRGASFLKENLPLCFIRSIIIVVIARLFEAEAIQKASILRLPHRAKAILAMMKENCGVYRNRIDPASSTG